MWHDGEWPGADRLPAAPDRPVSRSDPRRKHIVLARTAMATSLNNVRTSALRPLWLKELLSCSTCRLRPRQQEAGGAGSCPGERTLPTHVAALRGVEYRLTLHSALRRVVNCISTRLGFQNRDGGARHGFGVAARAEQAGTMGASLPGHTATDLCPVSWALSTCRTWTWTWTWTTTKLATPRCVFQRWLSPGASATRFGCGAVTLHPL